MNAQEANKRAYEVNISAAKSDYIRAMKEIEIAANRGAYSVTINGSINGDAQKQLEKDGFSIRHGSQHNESYTIIEWKNIWQEKMR